MRFAGKLNYLQLFSVRQRTVISLNLIQNGEHQLRSFEGTVTGSRYCVKFLCCHESNQNSQDSISEHFGTGTAPPVAMSEGQVRNEESYEFGQSLEAYNIHLSRNVREIVCKPKPCAFFDAFSSPLIFLFALKLEEI